MTAQTNLTVHKKAGNGLCCPACNHPENAVVDSRPALLGGAIHSLRRRRKCESCGRRFTTYELPAEVIEALDALANDAIVVRRSAVIKACIAQLEEML